MQLEQFLKTLFDKQIDNYPNIRETILCNLPREDARSVYHAFRFIPSQAEKVRCIGYTYFEHGIFISCDIMSSNIYPIHTIVNSRQSMIYSINTTISKWIERIGISVVPITDGKTTSCMSMSSENIEFCRSISIFICKEKIMVPYNISITTKVIRKIDGRVIIARSKLETPQQYVFSIFEKLNIFCAHLSLPLDLERLEFNNIISRASERS